MQLKSKMRDYAKRYACSFGWAGSVDRLEQKLEAHMGIGT